MSELSATVSWPVIAEIECAARIVEGMSHDIARVEEAIAPSKRGTRFQRALDDLKGKIGAATLCLEDARKKLENTNG